VKPGETISQENIGAGIRVARVSTVAFFVETQLHAQLSSLVQHGFDVTIIASEPALERPVQGADYRSVEIPRKISLAKDLRALYALYRLFKERRFDIVHSTTPKAGLLCALAGSLARVPVRMHTFTGQPWVGLSGLKKQLSKSSDRLIGWLNTRCFADSESQRRFIVEQNVVVPDRIDVLGSGSLAGINLRRFDPKRVEFTDRDRLKKELGIASETDVLLFVGRLATDKGIKELLAAFEAVAEQRENVTLVLAGPLESDIDASLRSLPESVRAKIVAPGFIAEPERYMAVADLLVIPSYREGFGTVVIEAAAMGLAAVGTDIYGLSDAIIDGETGALVPVRNAEVLAAALLKLLADPTRRQALGRNARARVQREYSEQHMTRLLMDEYVRLLNEERGQ